MTMNISDKGLQLIARFEGCVLKLYNDPVGYCTIGYGHLVHKGRVGTKPALEAPYSNGITQTEAINLLRADAATHVAAMNAALRVPVTQNQFDALVSLSFNIGSFGAAKSSLMKAINAGKVSDSALIRSLFCLWCRAGGQVNTALLGRRNSEATYFLGV
jgi:lysozyme